MATKYTGKELTVKREIDRINRQIRQAYTKFGKESRLAQQYETLLYLGQKGRAGNTPIAQMMYGEGVRYTKEGIPQIRASKQAITEFANISYYEKQLKILGRQQTVQQAQTAIVKAYEAKTGQKVKGRAATKAAIEQEIQAYKESEKAFANGLSKLYEIEKKRGIRLKAHEDIKKLSKGLWTSQDDFEKMNQILEKALQEDNAQIVGDVFAQNQW